MYYVCFFSKLNDDDDDDGDVDNEIVSL